MKKSLETLLIGPRPYKHKKKVNEEEATIFAEDMLRDLMEEGMHGGRHHFNRTKYPSSDWDGTHQEGSDRPDSMDWDSGGLGYSDHGEGVYW